MAQDTSYGVMTLFQSDIPGNNLPSGYNTPERLEFVKSWIDQASAIGSEEVVLPIRPFQQRFKVDPGFIYAANFSGAGFVS